VLVVGGGVSGLYCAWELVERGYKNIAVMEMSNLWGGRIETVMMEGFVAEYGPMRFEPKVQPRFKTLVDALGLTLVPFVGPRAPVIEYPKYALEGDEQKIPNANALLMLRRGLLLIMGRPLPPDDPAGERQQDWIDGLDEIEYARIRQTQTLPGDKTVLLWQTGLWNALAAAGMSHQAVMLIRDVGTFYHMLPDNLNAVEWTIWWLRAFTTAGKELETVKGGSGRITDELLKKLQGKVRLLPRHEVTALRPAGNEVLVNFTDGRPGSVRARHVILALPQAPLRAIADGARPSTFPAQIRRDLESVNGFPMLKVFFVVKNPWWTPTTPPQTRANKMPTREVHYFRDGDLGMVLIYTDRPATEYWKHYVVGETHDRAELDKNDALKKQFARWMAKEIRVGIASQKWPLAQTALRTAAKLLQKNDNTLASAAGLFALVTLEFAERAALWDERRLAAEVEKSVVTYGIRDWSRPPYGAANHSWKPKMKSWEVTKRLAGFRLEAGGAENVHICGEAYSDYSGFIEGALNSAHLVLEKFKPNNVVRRAPRRHK
jgi:monoamine oxidase